jgi:hypothetical protein
VLLDCNLFRLDAFSACGSPQICYPAHMMQRESKMDDNTAKLRTLRLAKEQAEKRSLQARRVAREQTRSAMLDKLGERARRANETGQADPLLDRIFDIKS